MSLLREPPWVRFTSTSWVGKPGSIVLMDEQGNPYASNMVVNLSTIENNIININVPNLSGSGSSTTELTMSNTTESHVGGTPIENRGVLFVENGALKYHGSNGTITTLADA